MKTAIASIVTVSMAWAFAPESAHAQHGADVMQASMTEYFRGERLGGVGFVSVGAASVIAGGVMYTNDSDFQRGMSYALIGLGGVQVLVGGGVMFQAGPRIRRFSRAIRERPQWYRERESKRIRGVNRTMRLLLATEVVFIAGGVTLAVVGNRSDRDTLSGIGAGLAVEAAVLLVQDALVARRARRYARALDGFQIALSPADRRYLLGYRVDF